VKNDQSAVILQDQSIPLLILAQSGRFLAQSASQAGYTVWLADCFGDQDSLAVVDRWQALPPLSTLTPNSILQQLNTLSRGEPCYLICGSGIEQYYPFLSQLPDNIEPIGNTADSIQQVKDPQYFFTLLSRLDLNFPETQFTLPQEEGEHWLVKSTSGLGGGHIQTVTPSLANRNDKEKVYFQRYIQGQSGSILFLANGQQSLTLSINKQILAPTQQSPFRLGGVESSWQIPAQHQQTLDQAIQAIVKETGLLGLNSIDFIISKNNDLLILEVNPRPSASAELIECKDPLIYYHIIACQGQLPKYITIRSYHSLRYHYASHELTVPDNLLWHKYCYDRPKTGTVINKGSPIFSTIVPNDKTELHAIITITIQQQFEG